MLIGVTGRAQHGKDSVGKLLAEEFGFRRYAFADQLKSMALALNPIVQAYQFPKHPERLAVLVELLGWDKAKEMAEVRRFLQALGTEGVRDHLGENSWVNALEVKLKQEVSWTFKLEPNPLGDHSIPADDVVVTDVRFPNEAEWVKHMDGELWRVKRVVAEPADSPDFYETDEEVPVQFTPFDNGLGLDHPSEKYVDDLPADRKIVASSLSHLKSQVRAIMEEKR